MGKDRSVGVRRLNDWGLKNVLQPLRSAKLEIVPWVLDV
jgi:hypothetical protein